MLIRIKIILSILPIITAFSPISNEYIKVDYYYNLKFLKNSSHPREIKIINVDNIIYHKRVAEKGLLLTYKNRGAKDVKIAGNFSNWASLQMKRGKYGVWYFFLSGYLLRKEIRYKFLVDGIWIVDPKNHNREDDGIGSYVSIVNLTPPVEGKDLSFRFIDKNLVEFRIYKPHAKLIAIVGDFNNWNTENDLLEKGIDDVWRLRKRLQIGKYRYKFIIDGEWVVDPYNAKSASDEVGGICSVIEVK